MRPGARRRGVTMVEAVISSVLLFVLIGGVVAIGRAASFDWSANTSKVLADNDVSLAIQQLAQRVRQGRSATVSEDGTELLVVYPGLTATGDFDRNTVGEDYLFFLEDDTLYQSDSDGARVTLGQRITSVQFGVSGTEVAITLTSRQQQGSVARTTSQRIYVALRNNPNTQ